MTHVEKRQRSWTWKDQTGPVCSKLRNEGNQEANSCMLIGSLLRRRVFAIWTYNTCGPLGRRRGLLVKSARKCILCLSKLTPPYLITKLDAVQEPIFKSAFVGEEEVIFYTTESHTDVDSSAALAKLDLTTLNYEFSRKTHWSTLYPINFWRHLMKLQTDF